MPSLSPLTSSAPVGLHASAYIIVLCSLQICWRCQLLASQTMSSPLPLLPPPLASLEPSGLHTTLSTMPPCPCSEARSCPVEASHRQTLPSSLQLMRCVPSGLHSILRMMVGGVWLTQWLIPVVASHTCIPC